MHERPVIALRVRNQVQFGCSHCLVFEYSRVQILRGSIAFSPSRRWCVLNTGGGCTAWLYRRSHNGVMFLGQFFEIRLRLEV